MTKKFLYTDANADYVESAGAYETADHINVSTGVSDAGKPIVLDAAGLISSTMINQSAIDHGSIGGLGDDDHSQYILVAGTRAFTGDQSLGGFRLTSVANPTAAQDATTKAYVDAVAVGLRPHGNVAAATTAVLSGTFVADDSTPATGEKAYDTTLNTINWFATQGPTTIDGYTLVDGDRILVKDESASSGPSAGEGRIYNGIYVRTSQDVWTRSEDQDNAPLAEIMNGVFIPMVLNGTANADKPFVITSVGTGVDGLHTIGTDNIIFDIFTSPTQLQAGNGIAFNSNIVSVDFLTNGGLKFVSTQLAIEPADFAGEGLIDDGSDNLAIDWSTAFNDSKAVKASDLSSTASGLGASIIGVEDSGANYTATTVEGVLAEIATKLIDRDSATAGGTIAIGDLLYFSGNDTVSLLGVTTSNKAVGIALTAATVGNPVEYARWDEVAKGCLVGATAGARYFWTGTALSATVPTTSGQYVWQAGVAKNATDLLATVEFIKKNI